MADKQITVVINGEEYVSKAAEEAGASITLFGKKIPLVVDATKLLDMAMGALRSGFSAVKNFVVDSLRAYDEYAASQRKLEGTSKLTGVALSELQDISKRGTEGFKLSAVTANDFAAEIAKLTSKAGDLSQSKEAMEAFLDIGAARGLSASETLKAVQQAILGIDEGTDKLFGKNPSVIYKEYADKIGIAVGKMSDQQKAMALLDATMEGGEKVKGAYLDYLNSAAGQQDLLNQRVEQSKSQFGAALQPIRTLILHGLNKLLDALMPVVEWFGKAANAVGVTLVESFNKGRETAGNMVAALGRITGNKEMQKWGEETAKAARESIAAVADIVAKSGDGVKKATDVIKASTTANQAALKKQADEAAKEAERVEAILAKSLGKPLSTVIGITEGAIRSLASAAKDQLPADSAAKFDAHMVSLANNARLIGERITAVPPAVDKGQKSAKQMADDVMGVARGALDAAQAFGVIDSNAARSLDSAINIAGALGKIAASGFSFAGVTGVIGGVANLVSTMMQGDKERRELTRANTEALNKLRTDGVHLSNKASGDQIAGIAGALDPDLIGLLGKMTGEFQRTVGNQMLTKALAQAGLRLSDLDAVAGELGFNLRRDNGQIDLSQLPMFFAALQENMGALTRIGQTFGEQLQFFKESQRLSGASGMTQVGDLVTFLRNAGGADILGGVDLSDPTKTRDALFHLFTNLNNGGIGAGALGRLTGEQFQSVILELIGLIDNLKDAPAVSDSPTAPPSAQTTAVVESVGEVTMSVASVQDAIAAMDSSISTVLTGHTAIHERIAAATEGSYGELQTLNGKMDVVIDLMGGSVDRVNQALADARALALANAGTGPSYG